MSYQFRDKLHKFSFCFKETYLLQQGSQWDLSISNLLKVNFFPSPASYFKSPNVTVGLWVPEISQDWQDPDRKGSYQKSK